MTALFFSLFVLVLSFFSAACVTNARERAAVNALVEAKLDAHLKSQAVNIARAPAAHSKGA